MDSSKLVSLLINMWHIKHKLLNFRNSALKCCVFLRALGKGGWVKCWWGCTVQEDWGGSTPRLNVFNITCSDRGSSKPQPAFELQFGSVSHCMFSCLCERLSRRLCVCLDGHRCLMWRWRRCAVGLLVVAGELLLSPWLCPNPNW